MDDAPRGTRIDTEVRVRDVPIGMWSAAFFAPRTPRETKVIASQGGDTDPTATDVTTTVPVTIGVGTGCAELQEAQLYAAGDTLRTRLNLGEDHSECYRPYSYLLTFSVPRDRLPQNPLYKDAPPRDPGVGVVVSVDEVTVGSVPAPWRVVEVTDGDQLAEWIVQNGGGPPARQGIRVDPVRAVGERRFAFLVLSCESPRTLRVTVGPDGVPALSTGGGTPYRPQSCSSREHYLVVYDLPADAWSGIPLGYAAIVP
ncbi:hypothetical protein [Yinghuangia sp. YIM S09857]|uniref:hypothetical protein n=1 Tax=Yinghuangia sp. YIM S09857 TaxID=3436929 RepID=UPI003F52FB4B